MRQEAHIKQYRKLKRLEYYKKWHQENPEKRSEYNKKWRQENREYDKKYYQENREKHLEYTKKYYQENREYMKKWRQENREKRLEYHKKWHQENPEYNKKWYQENPEKRLEQHKRQFAKLARPLNMGMYEIMYCLTSWANLIKQDNCQICGNPPKEAHHILYKKYYPELMLNENNGIALCKRCHWEAHGKKLDLIKPLEPIIDIRSFGVVGVKN